MKKIVMILSLFLVGFTLEGYKGKKKLSNNLKKLTKAKVEKIKEEVKKINNLINKAKEELKEASEENKIKIKENIKSLNIKRNLLLVGWGRLKINS